MMSGEQRQLVHNQIILDLAIHTLERDHKYVDGLKSKMALDAWFEIKIKEAKKEKTVICTGDTN